MHFLKLMVFQQSLGFMCKYEQLKMCYSKQDIGNPFVFYLQTFMCDSK